ncbi:cysteine desulfurase SufS [Clostridium ragsdalei P11]|uniref:Cysteine desulfurase SufS n=1 Tax=Clostridium ragsdalei P11 TaxID=1353534 RepID=A0A1A6AYL9_9CLOT|nr:aminotransferase class V-fold PLP-dependent enzyme [Clostridium ragsdalei]OBR95142.1 cysteine desulfurase SufS [Clostridium ragsdalei P11]
MNKCIYLDNAATTFPKPEAVYKKMDLVNRTLAVNAGRGSYKLAREATELIDNTKSKLLELINAKRNAYIAFTPSVTIALNQILQGIKYSNSSVVYVSPFEHNAVARTLNLLKKRHGFKLIELPLQSESLEMDLDKMKYMFSKDNPSCVCVTAVSNVTGYILPVKNIFKEAKKYQAITVLDAAQAMGLIPIDFKELEADFIAFAGHKTMYGPFGIGGVIMNKNATLDEVIVGGTGSDSLNLDMPQPYPGKLESASKNIVAVAGLNAALDEIDIDKSFKYEKELTNYLIDKLDKVLEVKLYLPKDRSKHISIVSFTVDRMSSENVGIILDEDFNIAVRTGYHCAPYIHKYLKDKSSLGTVRVGLGRFNNKSDIDEFIKAVNDIIAG